MFLLVKTQKTLLLYNQLRVKPVYGVSQHEHEMNNIIHVHNTTEASCILRFSRGRKKKNNRKGNLYHYTYTHTPLQMSVQIKNKQFEKENEFHHYIVRVMEVDKRADVTEAASGYGHTALGLSAAIEAQ